MHCHTVVFHHKGAWMCFVLPMLWVCFHGNRIKLLVQFRQQQMSDLQDVRDTLDVEVQQERRMEQKLRVCLVLNTPLDLTAEAQQFD